MSTSSLAASQMYPDRSDNVLLTAANVTRRFGGVVAVNDASIHVNSGEIAGLIGPNGAGKTTFFNLITGLDRPDSGVVLLENRDITRKPAHQFVDMGIARTFQNIRLLSELSVEDNVKVAFHRKVRYTNFHAIFRLPRFFREEHEIREKSSEFIEFFGLGPLRHEKAGSLAYGQRRKLEMARAMATGARLLLLDEPAAGMNPHETDELMDSIRRINSEFKSTILLIEHDMKLVMAICCRLMVMDHGKVISTGTPAEVRSDPRVIEAYLGPGKEHA